MTNTQEREELQMGDWIRLVKKERVCVLSVSIRSYLPGFSSNYPAQRLAYLVRVAGGIQDRSDVPQLR